MLKEETWSVSIQQARAFFRDQEDVTEKGISEANDKLPKRLTDVPQDP